MGTSITSPKPHSAKVGGLTVPYPYTALQVHIYIYRHFTHAYQFQHARRYINTLTGSQITSFREPGGGRAPKSKLSDPGWLGTGTTATERVSTCHAQFKINDPQYLSNALWVKPDIFVLCPILIFTQYSTNTIRDNDYGLIEQGRSTELYAEASSPPSMITFARCE